MKQEIQKVLEQIVSRETILKIEDASEKHSYHGHGFGKESHFELMLDGKNLSLIQKIDLHKKITIALGYLYSKNRVHSITIKFT
jgi:stress-induced morphogen